MPLGKTTFFVANQAKLENASPEEIKELNATAARAEEETKELSAKVKTANAGTLSTSHIPLI